MNFFSSLFALGDLGPGFPEAPVLQTIMFIRCCIVNKKHFWRFSPIFQFVFSFFVDLNLYFCLLNWTVDLHKKSFVNIVRPISLNSLNIVTFFIKLVNTCGTYRNIVKHKSLEKYSFCFWISRLRSSGGCPVTSAALISSPTWWIC